MCHSGMALGDYKLEIRNIQYYYARKKNPDIVVISITDTNFPENLLFILFSRDTLQRTGAIFSAVMVQQAQGFDLLSSW